MYVHQLKQEVATTWKTGSSYISNTSGSVNGRRPVTLKSGDGIKSPPFTPSRVGKDEILNKASSSLSSCVLSVTENIFLAKFNLALMLYFGRGLGRNTHQTLG